MTAVDKLRMTVEIMENAQGGAVEDKARGGVIGRVNVRRNGYRTVIENNEVYHVKHPLQTHWTLTQKLGSAASTGTRLVSQSAWEDTLKESVTIGTVEDFWW